MPLNRPIIDWPQQRAWIVGASTGIGAALAQALVARGARVAISARSEAKLNAIADADRLVRVLPLDVTDAQAFTAAHAALKVEWGGVDLVVFMAGTYFPVRAWELDAGQAKVLTDTNLIGVFNGLAAVLPDLLSRGAGAVAIVSSVAGYRGLPKSLLYGPSKAALINLAETLYMDCAPRGVGVFLVNPGFVKTPLTDQNEFEMPHLITAEEAATAMIAGFGRGEFEIHFPKAFTRRLKLLRLLPFGLYQALIRRSTGL